MCASRPVKRSRSEPEINRWTTTQSEQKRRRGAVLNNSRSAEDLRNHTHDVTEQPENSNEESDPRDLLQLALDRICELQRKLMQRGPSCSDGNILQEFQGEEIDESETDEEETDSSFQDREVVLAGYEYCHKEALRFLVEEENLGPEHPAVRELSAHLAARKNGIDTAQVLTNYMTSPSAESINV